ncbi:hypothetical protein ASPBRDRAFT_359436 [Aspergillus brasiliensis CBS 101740]|uniref:Uncharacterized protein n=1 Tax=Aspergillus brasiliensis (strain CBS 101740 / IMI 381727 / IBT 21946) TaxID=767769 RepID=A0A1L9U5Q4_ASPBC|nr:hypothetical protein ASPBRDRAFT_359436 [Aspergillus brasiliensis CBS 101740]
MTLTYFASLNEQHFMNPSGTTTPNKWNRYLVLCMFDNLHACNRFRDRLSIDDFPQRSVPAIRMRRARLNIDINELPEGDPATVNKEERPLLEDSDGSDYSDNEAGTTGSYSQGQGQGIQHENGMATIVSRTGGQGQRRQNLNEAERGYGSEGEGEGVYGCGDQNNCTEQEPGDANRTRRSTALVRTRNSTTLGRDSNTQAPRVVNNAR